MHSALDSLCGPGRPLKAEPPELPHTLGLGPEVWRILSKAHEIRNRAEYEGDIGVDERVVHDLIAACGIVA
jgi:hypothetical protein